MSSNVDRALIDRLAAAVAGTVPARSPLVVGLCGAQGSGKSTLAAALAAALRDAGRTVAILSLDDLYKTKAARLALARDVHPLFRTRGVPGTHDLDLAFDALAALARGEAALFPRFDKGRDDRAPRDRWAPVAAGTQVVILEGWCVGATPLPATLAAPINRLEAEEDGDGRWRAAVATALAGDYQRLFAAIDLLILLEAPGFDVVSDWRAEQERPLQARGEGMGEAELARFVAHYERLTRHILATMPAAADVVVRLDAARRVLDIAGA